MSGILTQAPKQATPHRAASTGRSFNPQPRRPGGPGPGGLGPGNRPGGGHDHVRPPRATHWTTTPNLLRAGGVLIVLLALATAVATASYAGSAHGKIAAIGHTDAPSVHGTGDFLLRVEDMDAQLANSLLISGDTSLRTTREQSEKIYEADRWAADADLQGATTALAGNTAALSQLNEVVDMFGTYQQLATRALQLDEQSNTTKAGTAPAKVVAAYRDALTYLAGADGTTAGPSTLIGHASALYDASNRDIASAAQDADDTMSNAEGALFGLSLLLLCALIFVQWRMARRFRRTMNPGLAAASLTVVVLLISGIASFQSAISDFHSGKSDAFDSVQSLTMAKAISYDANADESRWLLDPGNAQQYEAGFLGKSLKIARPESVTSEPDLASFEKDIAQADLSLTANPTFSASGLDRANPLSKDSLLGFELGNVTFDGEQQKALTAVSDYDTYLQGDAKIRQFPISTPAGLHDAVDFDTDARTAGTSDAAFNAYSDALDQVIDLNQGQFEASMSSALAETGAWAWSPYLYLALIVGLAALGLRPRLAEYRR